MAKTPRSLEESLHGMGLHSSIPGGDRRFDDMLRLFGPDIAVEILEDEADGLHEGQEADAEIDASVAAGDLTPVEGAVDENAQPSDAAGAAQDTLGEDAYGGGVLTEELLERIESLNFDSLTEAHAERVTQMVERLLDKEIPEALEDRVVSLIEELHEKKLLRIVKGIVKRVNKRIGSKWNKLRRKLKIWRRKRRSKIKLQRKKRERKAPAKIAAKKTARKRLALFGKKLKKKVSKAAKKIATAVGNVKNRLKGGGNMGESTFASKLRNILSEGVDVLSEAQRDRGELIALIGDIAENLDYLFDADTMDIIAEEYVRLADDYCAGSLHEDKLDEGAFISSITPLLRVIGCCEEELEKNA